MEMIVSSWVFYVAKVYFAQTFGSKSNIHNDTPSSNFGSKMSKK